MTINIFLAYLFICWGVNILLNFLYIIKRYAPVTKSWDRPLDGGLAYKGSRLIGESTTVVGLIMCLAISTLWYLLGYDPMWAGIPLLVYLGHMTGSIIKRRMGKGGGEFVPIVDHGDYVILTGIVFLAAGYIGVRFFILSLLVTYALHPLLCFIAYKLRLRERPY